MARFTALMYTVDDSDDEETVYLVDTCPQQATALLHKWHALLGSGPPRGHSQTCMRIGVTSRPSWL